MHASHVILSIAVFISIVTNAVTQNRKQCKNGKVLVTINRDYEPHWYQKKFDRCVDGNLITEFTSYVLTFTERRNVEEIANFPLVKDIFMDRIDLDKIPVLLNLPKLEKISLSSNEIKTIEKQVSQVPVKVLIFSSNQITTIEDGAFGSNVEKIFLTCNNLTLMSPTWFTNPANLVFLNMGGNQISAVPDNMFKDFVNLNSLELRNNQIKTLGVGSLSGPTDMRWLQLSYNMISDIKANVIGNKLTVRRMDIQYNRLSFLHEALMDKMNVTDFRIWGNPWQCPCRDLILNWIDTNNRKLETGLPRPEDPNCVYALSFQKSCVPFVDDELYKTFLQNFVITPVQFC